MTTFSPGNRIITPTGKLGTVLPPPWTMPMHTLILLDGHDSPRWILTDILQLVSRCPAQQQPAAEPMLQVVAMQQLALFEDAA